MAKCFDFASKARDRIVIQSRGVVNTDLGGQTVTWGTENTVYAIINPVTGREIFAQDQQQSRVTHKFLIRYLAVYKDTSDTANRRISFDDRFFSVKNIKNLDDTIKMHGTAYQELLCEDNGAVNDG